MTSRWMNLEYRNLGDFASWKIKQFIFICMWIRFVAHVSSFHHSFALPGVVSYWINHVGQRLGTIDRWMHVTKDALA